MKFLGHIGHMHTELWLDNLRGRTTLANLDVDGRIILKLIPQK